MSNRRQIPFWEAKSLTQMTPDEWEALCDGCGRCCLVVLEDEDPDAAAPDEPQYLETSVCCHLFDPATRRCSDYRNRKAIVPSCVTLTPEKAERLAWMPESCAYRRLAEGRGLASWHPLVSGRRESVAEAGVAVSDRVISERSVSLDDLWAYVTGPRT